MAFRVTAVLAALFLLTGFSACARGGRVVSKDGAGPVSGASQSEAETVLRGIVAEHVRTEQRRGNSGDPDLVRRRPYFYREFVEYPGGSEQMEITLRENDSRTRPLTGEVRLDKVRYSTRMHRDRGEALGDGAFIRDTGVESLNYELRNGRWHRVGSLFVADKTEEYADGQWVPRREELVRVNPDDKPGWFSRTWSKITGRDTE
ncbi:MAG: hypothetical protein GX580_08200 [Candidatus Hydrogenedens sp.]|nr:hypothetical protein [Candidatus Hydrogenedentota bacterium]NLF57605.1 hypothetical protein [Candidatus Hydrogenedens sp.]